MVIPLIRLIKYFIKMSWQMSVPVVTVKYIALWNVTIIGNCHAGPRCLSDPGTK